MATSTAAAAKAAAPAMAMATATASFCLRSNCHVNTCCQNNIQSSMTLKVKASQIQSSTTSRRQRRPQNVDGDIFVDHTCIDCDTCRWMAPEIFTRVDGMSAVFKQPSSEEERLKALQALLSCPTSSIRTEGPPCDILEVQKTFPIPINEQKLPGVYHCGFHSEKSYGAASYLVVRSEGNILIDSPRYTERLAQSIKEMGGARYMFLTHQDDVADHEKWSEKLGCQRILHLEDVNISTANVEVKLEGSGPWSLDDDITLIHTPGHTQGSVCLFYKSNKVLFTGDHLLMDESGLSIIEEYNWFSVPTQLNSVRKLLELDFEWILPGNPSHREQSVILASKPHTSVKMTVALSSDGDFEIPLFSLFPTSSSKSFMPDIRRKFLWEKGLALCRFIRLSLPLHLSSLPARIPQCLLSFFALIVVFSFLFSVLSSLDSIVY